MTAREVPILQPRFAAPVTPALVTKDEESLLRNAHAARGDYRNCTQTRGTAHLAVCGRRVLPRRYWKWLRTSLCFVILRNEIEDRPNLLAFDFERTCSNQSSTIGNGISARANRPTLFLHGTPRFQNQKEEKDQLDGRCRGNCKATLVLLRENY
jgi:hypothetical protein